MVHSLSPLSKEELWRRFPFRDARDFEDASSALLAMLLLNPLLHEDLHSAVFSLAMDSDRASSIASVCVFCDPPFS
jgi:hypothetical protein